MQLKCAFVITSNGQDTAFYFIPMVWWFVAAIPSSDQILSANQLAVNDINDNNEDDSEDDKAGVIPKCG